MEGALSVLSLLFLAYIGLPAEGAIVCYECETNIGMACGLTRWEKSYLEGSTKLCDAGMCFTYVKTEANGRAPLVTRGCGQLDCNRLPLGYNRTVECEFIGNEWRVRKVQSGLFNQSRVYNTQSGEREMSSGVLQYCDQERCNSGQIQLATLPATFQEINVKPPTSCFSCKSYADQACGLRGMGGGPVTEVNCSVGYCFTYVRAEAGTAPMVIRGCGGISCNLIPGASGSSVLCDENNVLAPPDTSDGQLFNQSRSFTQPFAPGQALASGTVQYCNNGPKCNSGPISGFKLKNYYYLTDSGATEIAVAVSALLAGLIVTWMV